MSMVELDLEQISLVPQRRLGALLSSARAAKGFTLEEVAEQSGGRFSTAALASIERGTRTSSDPELRALSALYGLEATSLVPARSKLVIDLDEGLMVVEDNRTKLSKHARDREDVLSRYLAMVYSMRQLEPGTQVPLRVDDLDVLGRALRVGTRTLESDLLSLMSNPRDVGWRSRVLRKKVLIPAAGVLVAVCGAGALVLVSSDGAAQSGTSLHNGVQGTSLVSVGAQVGSAAVQERAADGSPGPIVVRGASTSTSTVDTGVSLIDPIVQQRSAPGN